MARLLPRRCVHLTLVTLVTLALSATGSMAAQAAEPVATDLGVTVETPANPDIPYRLAATLTAEGGNAISGASVTLYAVVDLLGERTALLGTGTTDIAGTARVPVAPRKGDYRIVAHFGGDGEHAPSEITQTVTFPEAAIAPFVPGDTEVLLEPVRDFMPPAISAAVAALWAGLFALALSTVLTIRRAGELNPDIPTKETVS